MDATAIARTLIRYGQVKSMADPVRYCSTGQHRDLFPEAYAFVPMSAPIPPEEREALRQSKRRMTEALESLVRGEKPEAGEMEALFDCTPEELESLLEELNPIISPVPDKLVVLTFDDATRDHLEHAAPILKDLGFGATFFVTEMDMPDASFSDKSRFMTWDEIHELHTMGFEIGNHTLHHKMTRDFDREDFLREIDGLSDRCAQHGIPRPVSFAYPGGMCTPGQIEAVRERGCSWARGNDPTGVCGCMGASYYVPTADSPLTIPSYGDAPLYTYSQLLRRVSDARDGHVVCLAYHEVGKPEKWPGEGDFCSHMRLLRDRGYKGISIGQLARYIDPERAWQYTHL